MTARVGGDAFTASAPAPTPMPGGSATSKFWRNCGSMPVLLGGSLAIVLVVLVLGAVSNSRLSAVALMLVALSFAAMVVVRFPSTILGVVLPASFLTYRVPIGLGSLSVADAVTALAILSLLIYWPRLRHGGISVEFRIFLAFAFTSIVLMLAVVAAHPSGGALAELLHRSALVVGGAAVGSRMRDEVVVGSLRIFLLVALVFSVAATILAVTTGGPAYPLGVTKNHAGGLIAVALLIVLTTDIGLHSLARYSAAIVMLAGLAATDSRAGMISLLACLAYACVVDRAARRRLILPLVIAVVMAGAAAASLQAERAVPADVALSSANERLSFWNHAYNDWLTYPILGNGIGYYVDPQYNFPAPKTAEFPDGAAPNPHNIVMQTLAESGVVGMVAFFVLICGTLAVVVRATSGPYKVAAQVVLVATACIGLFDIFWLAGRTIVPFVLVGVALRESRSTLALEKTFELGALSKKPAAS